MAHLDPTQSLDTLPEIGVADVDTEAEGGDTWVIIFNDAIMGKISLQNLMTVIATLMEAAGEVHSHA
jgi:hypothetical protein